VLYRRYPFTPGAGLAEPGGPLYVPRLDQGDGRHDNPDVYGALYLSRVPASPIAELLRDAPQGALQPALLLHEGEPYRLAAFDDSLADLVDLDDPRTLLLRALRPSGVATRDRERTQTLGLSIYREGASGFEWWSTIESSWINVTVFAERSADRLTLTGEPEALTLDHPAVREAADAVGVLLEP
jgi:RES domain